MSVVVRVACKDDDEILAALRRLWGEEEFGGPIDDAGFEDDFCAWLASERATRTFFIVEVDGRPVGMANVKEYCRMPMPGRAEGSWGYVGNVFVLAECRNRLIGRKLMDDLIAWSWAKGHNKLRLSPSEQALPFYGRLGFVRGQVIQLDR